MAVSYARGVDNPWAPRLAILVAGGVLFVSLFFQWYRLEAGPTVTVPRSYIDLSAWQVYSAGNVLIVVAALSGVLFAVASIGAQLGRGAMLLPEGIVVAALALILYRILHLPHVHYPARLIPLFGSNLEVKVAAAAIVAGVAALVLLAAEVWLQRMIEETAPPAEDQPGGEA